MKHIFPAIGSWYKELQQGAIFEVVAVDETAQTIETQMIDGEVSSYDFDSWRELIVDEVEEPEDWSNAYEMDSEDIVDQDAAIRPEDWSGPLNNIEPDIINGILDDL
jgi:hypothetical protein